MILLLVLVGVALATAAAFSRWRTVLLIIIAVAAFQDPLRKIMPGTPGWMTILSAPIFFAAALSSRLALPRWWTQFAASYPIIAKRLIITAVLSLPAAAISLTYGSGSWKFTILGIFAYSLIFVSIIVGFHLARDLKAIRRILIVYVVLHSAMLSGGLFQYFKVFPDWVLIGDAALGFEWLRYIPGRILVLISGFYRSADVMGWHAAAVSMLAMILAFSGRGKSRWFWIGISAWAFFALLLCGRRKMVYMIPIFLMALTWIYFYSGRTAKVLPMLGLILIPAASLYYVSDVLDEDSSQIYYYTTAGEGDSAFDRLEQHGFNAVIGTVMQSGFFGAGLGFATPGAHHLTGERPYTWQESGTSRVVSELGVPGFLGFIMVMVSIVSALWSTTRTQVRARTPVSVYSAGLLGFFLANVASLAISGQILADSFIVIFLGTMVGVVLGFNRNEFVAAGLSAPVRRPS